MTITCSCGYGADSQTDLVDHLGEVFIPRDDIAPDGQVHAEPARGGRVPDPLILTCTCGFTTGDTATMDGHFLRVFIPDDLIGPDGSKHAPTPDAES